MGRKKGKNKSNIVHYPANNTVILTDKKIIELETNNAYGVLLHTRESIEEFQKNSGMEGIYKKEYQHHYWSAVARLQIDSQFLDIAIPLVMFNYEQEITGGDIKFNLEIVQTESDKYHDLAMKKFNELKETPIYKYITEEMGIITWQIIPMNTGHVHPGGEHQRFSGIDLRKEVDYPGVVYPLSEGHNIPSFSLIMAHIKEKAKIVHSEYRIFIGEEKKKTYIKGRCATIVKGYEPEPLPRVVQPEPVIQGTIDKIFNIMPAQPTKLIQKEADPMPSYILRDKLLLVNGEEFLKEVTEHWEKTDYEPDTENIFKENLETKKTTIGFQAEKKGRMVYNGETSSLFGKKQYVVSRDYSTYPELAKEPDESIIQFFEEIKLLEKELSEEKTLIIDDDDDDEYDSMYPYNDEFESQYSYFHEGYDNYHDYIAQANKKNKIAQEKIKKEKEIKEKPIVSNMSILYKGVTYSIEEINKIKFLLAEEGYIPQARILNMSDYNIVAYYISFYKN